MPTAQEYAKRVDTVMEPIKSFNAGTIPEAKLLVKQVSQVQKQLRLIKKEINLQEKAIRSSYTTAKVKVGKGGLRQSVLQGLFGKKIVGKMNASQRDEIRQNERAQIAPYENLTHLIDDRLLKLDAAKVDIERWIVEQQALQP